MSVDFRPFSASSAVLTLAVVAESDTYCPASVLWAGAGSACASSGAAPTVIIVATSMAFIFILTLLVATDSDILSGSGVGPDSFRPHHPACWQGIETDLCRSAERRGGTERVK